MSDDKYLTIAPSARELTVAKRREALVRERREAIEDSDLNLMQWMSDGLSQLDEECPVKPAGWTDEQFRVAKHALKPKGKVPFGLIAAHERVEARERQQGQVLGGGGSGINVVVIPQMVPASERIGREVVIDVGPDGRRIDPEK